MEAMKRKNPKEIVEVEYVFKNDLKCKLIDAYQIISNKLIVNEWENKDGKKEVTTEVSNGSSLCTGIR
jgi:hypothetical protein